MKKVILMFMMVLAVIMGFTSCNTTKFGLVYNVEVTGDGDGNFTIDFPQGHYTMNGTAALELQAGDSIPFNKVTTKAEVINSNKSKQLKALQAVNESVANDFTVNAASGTYDLNVNGVVTETGTGLSFSIHKRLTNREQSMNTVSDSTYDEFLYVR